MHLFAAAPAGCADDYLDSASHAVRSSETSAAAKSRRFIGRFEILSTLGQGSQGTVYLAADTRLGRQVALKTVLPAFEARLGRQGMATLLQEARMVSALSHPNIVPLYDAGEDGGISYLVFEFVQGRSLADLIRERGKLDIGQAAQIALALAQAVAYAHERNVLHRDIKPGNVMITQDGVARLMDFGIASHVAIGDPASRSLVGTPSYMAPEYVTEGIYQPSSDVFALGVVLYQMLTGEVPFRGSDSHETVRCIVQGSLVPASRHNGAIDERLDAVLTKALARQPAERFGRAADMAAALAEYLEPPDTTGQPGAARGTLEYLLRRIRHKGDFPALSATISAVNRAASSDREPVAVLCNSILKDFALTSRLLKIVNASNLNQFGGSIGTVSRAISILGYDTVRNVSMSLLLFEHMYDRSNALALKDQVVSVYFSGLLAREMCDRADLREAEQAFICAMFHRLGKLLATFYLYEEAQVVERNMHSRGWDEQRASREVLGVSYEDLGVGVGKAWNLPEDIIDSMRPMTGPLKKCPGQQSEKLRMIASLSNELADAIHDPDEAGRKRRLAALVGRYGPATGITERTLTGAVQACSGALVRDAEALGPGVARNGFLQKARAWHPSDRTVEIEAPSPAGTEPPAADATANAAGAATLSAAARAAQALAETQRLVADEEPSNGPSGPAEPGRRQAALAAGVQDITNTLVGEHTLNDVLRIILETMYRAIGFDRALLFTLDARQQALRCRFGFGADAEVIVQKGVAIPLDGARDLFYAAAVMGADLCIQDVESDKVRPHVPAWYRAAIGARGMVLLPIVDRKRTVGLIYADSHSPATLHFSVEELGLLKTLRNQAVLAMRQYS
ncbi:MAG TPA: protein kinase [Burkholderiaceae bacterium]|nr:protein kinase [Burkholderiaceae bacterium]